MSFSRKTISIISASAIALGTCIPAGIAFADPDPVDPPSVGDQSGAGSTAMTMVWDNADAEYGGTEDPNNPPSDPNDPTSPGENLAFKAPTAINFVAKANGDLIAPSYSAVYLENFSASGIHVSSMQIEQGTGWNIVEDAAASANTANAVWGKIGPYNEKLNWYDHKSKTDVTTASKWGMAAAGAANNQSKLFLATEGKFANLNIDLSEAKTFGTIHWYLKMGGAGQRAVDPEDIHTLNKPTVASANGGFKLKTSLAAAAVSEDLNEAVEGDTVYIVAEPESGYVADEMTVTGVESQSNVSVTSNVNDDPNIGSFVMPEEDVDIEVTFENTVLSTTNVSIYNGNTLVETKTVKQLKADSAAIAADESWETNADREHDFAAPDTTTTTGLYASYMAGDYSFVFSDDPQSVPVKYRIIGLNHTNGEGITMMGKNVLNRGYYMNATSTNDGGWKDSALRVGLNTLNKEGIVSSPLDNVPQSVIMAAKPIEKTSNGGKMNGGVEDTSGTYSETTLDTFWVISLFELCGSNGVDPNAKPDVITNTQYDLFRIKGVSYSDKSFLVGMEKKSNGETRYTMNSGASGNVENHWWERGANGNKTNEFMCVGYYQNPSSPIVYRSYDARCSIGVIPCFAL